MSTTEQRRSVVYWVGYGTAVAACCAGLAIFTGLAIAAVREVWGWAVG